MPKGLFAYELLGVVLPTLPALTTAWRDMDAVHRRAYRRGLLQFVRKAHPIFKPEGAFAVITTLRNSDGMATVLEGWLHEHFLGQVERVALLDKPRTHDNMLKFKVATINAWGVERYWEPDPVLMRELNTRCPDTDVRWSQGLLLHENQH